MPIERPYPRGFLLHETGRHVDLRAGWTQTSLRPSSWTLSHDPELELDLRAADNGSSAVLVLGMCLYAGDENREISPAARLAEAWQHSTTALLDELDMLGGRFAVLTVEPDQVVIRQDAMGVRTVYFSPATRLVGSHANLLQEVAPLEERTAHEGRSAVLVTWSRTPYLGMDALLPNHELRLPEWSVQRFYPREANRYAHMSLAERLQLFRNRWDREQDDLRAQDADLVMSLTGGADSRTGLALSWKHREDFTMFTYTASTQGGGRYRKSLAQDRVIVDRLLEIMPEARHQYFYFDDSASELTETQQELVRRNTIGRHGPWLLPHYLREFSGGRHIHLRGAGYEVGRAYWDVRPETDTLDSLQALFMSSQRKKWSREPHAEALDYFHEGIRRWEYDGDLHGYHLRDLYYWEMRMGRWSAEIMNETDLAFETCIMINSRSLLEIALSFPLEDRRSGFFFAELINDSYPLLNFFGKNDLRNLYEITRDQQRKEQTSAKTEAVSLTPEVLIVTSDEMTTIPAHENLLQLPQKDFAPGTAALRSFSPARVDGELRFTVTSRYANPKAGGYWHCQIWVNDRLHVSWPAGTSDSPVHVTVTDLRAHDVVSIGNAALVDRRGTTSWSKASRAWIEDVVFEPRAPIGEACVGIDAPRATRP